MLSSSPRTLLTRAALAAALLFSPALAPGLHATAVLTTIHQFTDADPAAGLVQYSDGKLYGTTSGGGAYGLGTIFKCDTAGTVQTLHEFNGTDGACPRGALVLAGDGNFYGTTFNGGASNLGVIHRLTPAGVLTVIHEFDGADGAYPQAALIKGSDGALYGTASGGGHQYGLIFKITVGGVYTVVHDLAGDGSEGREPASALLEYPAGVFYGTTVLNATSNLGTVYKLDTTVGPAAYSVIHTFMGSDGGLVRSGLVRKGTLLYGTATAGGIGYGTVYSITTTGAVTVLYIFQGTDGSNPYAPLVLGSDGLFYGTTRQGNPSGSPSYGEIFKITDTGTLTTLHVFNDSDGTYPRAPLFQASDGDFYGVTQYGGTPAGDESSGTIFKVTTGGAFTSLHQFPVGGGTAPHAGLTPDGAGGFLGATTGGGLGSGTVFRLAGDGALTSLHLFSNFSTDGHYPDISPLLVSGSGALLGTTSYGGSSSLGGTVYKYDPATQVFTALFADFGSTIGQHPSGLLEASDGNFYGTTFEDSVNDEGTFFRLTPQGALTVLHSFSSAVDGRFPSADRLIEGAGGILYGITRNGGASDQGTFFAATTGGAVTTLHSFSGADGVGPTGGLTPGADGNFYGVTGGGGASSRGTVFKITPLGTVTTLHSFDGTDGMFPLSPLLLASDGNFYGTTNDSSNGAKGTLYRITSGGTLTTLHQFFESDGAHPYGNLTEDSDGSLLGTTSESQLAVTSTSSDFGYGTVYRAVLYVNGALQFGAASYQVNENAGSALITVTRAAGSAGAVSAQYTAGNGTAMAGTDYQTASGTLSWADGDTAPKSFTVPIIDRGISDNSTRTLTLTLSNPTGGAEFGANNPATLTIKENDPPAPTPTPTPTPNGTPTPPPSTPTPTPTPTSTPTPTPAPTPAPTATPTPTPTPAFPPPSVAFSSPPAGLTVVTGSDLPLALASDDPHHLIARVQFFLNGSPVGTVNSPAPLSLTVPAPAAGTYQVRAFVTDTFGRVQNLSQPLTAIAAETAGSPPSIEFLTDLDGQDTPRTFAAGTILPLSASASAADAAELAHVDFYADGVLFATLNGAGNPLPLPQAVGGQRPTRRDASPLATVFRASYPLPNLTKLISLVAVAIDKAGLAQASKVKLVQVVAGAADKPPAVSLGDGRGKVKVHVGAATSVPAAVSDPDSEGTAGPGGSVRAPGGPVRRAFDVSGVIARVEYYLNEVKVKDSAEAPFGFDVQVPAAGTYVLTAIATDGAGLATVSAPVIAEGINASTVSIKFLGAGQAIAGGARGRVLISRDGDASEDLTVYYKAKGSAKKDVDYPALSGSVVIPAGKSSVKLKVKALEDPAVRGPRVLKLRLLPSPDNSYDPAPGAPGGTKLRLIDSD